MARQIAFMVMPFSTKKTGLPPEAGGPAEVDFDALWEKALEPALADLGYTPVRADQDVGALIIVDMIERLAYSDLVVADISIANANVYYEIGVRHATKKHGCVLTSAAWGQTLFDIDQMPRLVYQLTDGSVPAADAATIRKVLLAGIPPLSEGQSPVFQAVPEYQESISNDQRAESFAADMKALNEVMNRINAVHKISNKDRKAEQARTLNTELGQEPKLQDGVRLAVMTMLRDCTDWETTIKYIEAMPELLQQKPFVREQLLLAKAKSGDAELAIASLEQLIEDAGPSTERFGLIGGRYKTLYFKAREEGDELSASRYLNEAIEAYEKGMMADLNEYYPTCNLPRLLRLRGDDGDVERARALSIVVQKACDRAEKLDANDEWIPLTRLGAAFDSEDPAVAGKLAKDILRKSEAIWKQNTTIVDLRESVDLVTDPARKRGLQEVLIELEAVLPEEERVTTLNAPPTSAAAAATALDAPDAAPAAAEPPAGEHLAARSEAETRRIESRGVIVTIRVETPE